MQANDEADSCIQTNALGLRVLKGNDGQTWYCGRRYCVRGECYCGQCGETCGPSTGCYCPSCAILSPNDPKRVKDYLPPAELILAAPSTTQLPSRQQTALSCPCDCSSRSCTECCYASLAVLFMLILYGAAVALLVYCYYLYVHYRHDACEKPLAEWVLSFAIVNTVPHLLGLLAIASALCNEDDILESLLPIGAGCVVMANLAVTIAGAVFVFQIDHGTHTCASALYDFSFGMNIAQWCVAGLACCIGCLLLICNLGH